MDTAELTVQLIPPNDIGTVSMGSRVEFTAKEVNSGASIGALKKEALSDTNGMATTSITGNVMGQIRIKCTVMEKRDKEASIIITFIESSV